MTDEEFYETLKNLSEADNHLMCADYAERVLPIFEKERPDDPRVRDCIETRRRFARGVATQEELAAARAAAGAAAWDAAWDAAWAAAWAAAGAAARAAAWDAARAAAGAAARAAAGAAAWAAAWDAAWDAEREWQKKRLVEFLAAKNSTPETQNDLIDALDEEPNGATLDEMLPDGETPEPFQESDMTAANGDVPMLSAIDVLDGRKKWHDVARGRVPGPQPTELDKLREAIAVGMAAENHQAHERPVHGWIEEPKWGHQQILDDADDLARKLLAMRGSK